MIREPAPWRRKGKRSTFLYLDKAADGNVSEPGDVGVSPGKSFLFFLIEGVTGAPWNRVIRREGPPEWGLGGGDPPRRHVA